MRPISVTVGPLATASATAVAASQSVAGGASVLINGSSASGGVATLDTPRRVIITSAGNDSGITFTVAGTNHAGNPISETVTGANAGVATSVLDYATVTSIKPSGATAAAVTAGTNGVAGSAWVRLDEWALPQVALHAVLSGTGNYTIQQTLDDPNSIANPIAPALVDWQTAVAAASSSAFSSLAVAPLFCRVVLNSGTGSVRMTVAQLGNTPF